jgi:hypothetical protein
MLLDHKQVASTEVIGPVHLLLNELERWRCCLQHDIVNTAKRRSI